MSRCGPRKCKKTKKKRKIFFQKFGAVFFKQAFFFFFLFFFFWDRIDLIKYYKCFKKSKRELGEEKFLCQMNLRNSLLNKDIQQILQL